MHKNVEKISRRSCDSTATVWAPCEFGNFHIVWRRSICDLGCSYMHITFGDEAVPLGMNLIQQKTSEVELDFSQYIPYTDMRIFAGPPINHLPGNVICDYWLCL